MLSEEGHAHSGLSPQRTDLKDNGLSYGRTDLGWVGVQAVSDELELHTTDLTHRSAVEEGQVRSFSGPSVGRGACPAADKDRDHG